ncbi:hypothetical protein RA210_U10527 [Rubrivivax sp. A210]|nr:hypothetical protein RA210_U10527 [Rubrivivax sp. A210]
MLTTAAATSKGQLTIPADVRQVMDAACQSSAVVVLALMSRRIEVGAPVRQVLRRLISEGLTGRRQPSFQLGDHVICGDAIASFLSASNRCETAREKRCFRPAAVDGLAKLDIGSNGRKGGCLHGGSPSHMQCVDCTPQDSVAPMQKPSCP